MDKPKYKVFLYARRPSDESSDKQLQSIEDQINNLKPLAARLGYKIVELKRIIRPILTRAATGKFGHESLSIFIRLRLQIY